jgi:integrase
MANLMKLTFTRYVDAQGRRVSKDTPGAKVVREKSSKWFGQYTDAEGQRRRVPLSSNKVVAQQMLAELIRDIERGKVGITDPYAEQRKAPIDSHVSDYETYLRNKGVSEKHLAETLRRLRAVLQGCEVRTLTDLRTEKVERFMAILADGNAGSRTRNTYRTSAKAFSKWCLKTRRIGEDFLASLEPASGETLRERRALPEGELVRLLTVARERPLLEALTVRTGKRKGLAVARVNPEVEDRLKRLGWERSLIYKTLILTGLRRGELAALEVRHLILTGHRPCLTLPGSSTKNRDAANQPLRADLVQDLTEWVGATRKVGTDRVFRVPVELVKILKRDLKLAGIPYRDENGRTFDVHALRHTTATYMSRGKVAPRVAQGFMRHSDIKLTMQTYTDHRLLDEAEALDALPDLPLAPGAAPKTAKAGDPGTARTG